MKKKTVEQKFRAKLLKQQSTISVPVFKGMSRNTEMMCACGYTFVSSPKSVLKTGCVECINVHLMMKKWRAFGTKLLKELAVRRTGLVIRAVHKTKPLVKLECKCGLSWNMNVLALINGLGKCPRCSAPQAVLEKTVSVHKKVSREILYVLGGQLRSFVPHAVCGKKAYYFAASFDVLTEVKAIARSCAKQNRVLELGLIVDKAVIPIPNWLQLDADGIQAVSRRTEFNSCTILSMDPGTNNYAWSVINVSRPFEVEVLASGMIKNTVNSLVGNVAQNADEFRTEVDALLKEFDPDFFIAERYMSRGHGGTTIELVNIMIGIVISMWTKNADRLKLIPAAQWKNEWNKHSNLVEFYSKVSCTVHQIDAIGIGIYGAAFWMDEVPFNSIAELEPRLVQQIEKTSRN